MSKLDGTSSFKADSREFIGFQWGEKKVFKNADVQNTGVQFYDSFTYDNVEYFVFDCVYMWRDKQPEPDIGVIVKIWETSTSDKKVKVVWFFRPRDIHNILGNAKFCKNEIFLASGEGKGLSNLNPLLAIAGKCNVVCTIKNEKNHQASDAELRMADFIFYRTFDVGTGILSDQFPNTIAGFRVERYFNKRKYLKLAPNFNQKLNEKIKKQTSSLKSVLHDQVGNDTTINWRPNSLEYQPLKKPKIVIDSSPKLFSNASLSKIGVKDVPTKLPDGTFDAQTLFMQNTNLCKGIIEKECNNQIFEITRMPNTESKKWFKRLPWEERMKNAHEQGTLVFLENLDPSYTSSEVEDIVGQALNERVEVRILERSTFSSSYNGEAFVIFKSKVIAAVAIDKLERKCLLLPSGRPLIAYVRTPTERNKSAKLVGHLELDNIKFQKQQRYMREAVATSHCSQANNIEYDFALKWCYLQEQTAAWWNALYQKQLSEIKKLTGSLKYTQISS